MLNTALTFTGWLHKDDTIRLVQDKRSSTFTLWPFFATFWGGGEITSQLEGYFGEEENGAAVPCSAWFRYAWRVRQGLALCLPWTFLAVVGLCGGGRDPHRAAHSHLFQRQAELSRGHALVILPALPGAGRCSSGASGPASWLKVASEDCWAQSALRRGVAGGCMQVSPPCTAMAPRCPRPWWGQQGQDTVLRKPPVQAQGFVPAPRRWQQGSRVAGGGNKQLWSTALLFGGHSFPRPLQPWVLGHDTCPCSAAAV